MENTEKQIKILGKVKDAKILVATRDRRSGRMNGLKGLVIEFETDEVITNTSVVYLVYKDKFKAFKVREVEILNDKLVGICEETGYYAHKLSGDTTLDIRTIIGCTVELVEDKEQLKKIYDQSCWC